MRPETRLAQRFAVSLLCLTALLAHAQRPDTGSTSKALSLQDALALAQQRYPAIKTALERQAAAQNQVGVARAAYLPRVDVLWQTNRATDDNRTA